MSLVDLRRLPARAGPLRRAMWRIGQGPPTINTIVDEDRPGWVVVTIAGSWETTTAADELASTLNRLLENHTTVAVDATAARALSAAACRILVAAGVICWQYGGSVTVTRPPSTAAMALRRLDIDGRLRVVGVRPQRS